MASPSHIPAGSAMKNFLGAVHILRTAGTPPTHIADGAWPNRIPMVTAADESDMRASRGNHLPAVHARRPPPSFAAHRVTSGSWVLLRRGRARPRPRGIAEPFSITVEQRARSRESVPLSDEKGRAS